MQLNKIYDKSAAISFNPLSHELIFMIAVGKFAMHAPDKQKLARFCKRCVYYAYQTRNIYEVQP